MFFGHLFVRQTQLEIEKAIAEDPSVYEYDSIYDDMQETKKQTDLSVKNKEKGKVTDLYVTYLSGMYR